VIEELHRALAHENLLKEDLPLIACSPEHRRAFERAVDDWDGYFVSFEDHNVVARRVNDLESENNKLSDELTEARAEIKRLEELTKAGGQ
jgi:hypothetical protein